MEMFNKREVSVLASLSFCLYVYAYNTFWKHKWKMLNVFWLAKYVYIYFFLFVYCKLEDEM